MVRAHLGPPLSAIVKILYLDDGGVNNQPLTIHFVGGFLFVASLLPGFGERLVEII